MMIKKWKEDLYRSSEKKICFSEGQLTLTLSLYENGTVVKKESGKDRILLVLEGECDLILGRGRYRMSAGSWMSIPNSAVYTLHTFRSCADCIVLLAETEGGTTNMVTSNIFDMPQYEGKVYFGLESAGMTGCLIPAAAEAQEGITLPLEHKGVPCLVNFREGKAENGYVAWLRDTYGILWQDGIITM